jgi:hypothetical protein
VERRAERPFAYIRATDAERDCRRR